jgi:hypothetical protein
MNKRAIRSDRKTSLRCLVDAVTKNVAYGEACPGNRGGFVIPVGAKAPKLNMKYASGTAKAVPLRSRLQHSHLELGLKPRN